MNPEHFEASDDERRQAYKINKLVDEEIITAEQASAASAEEIEETINALFSKDFSQNYNKPWEFHEKTMGQRAEDVLVELVNRFPFFRIRHETEQKDHEHKVDLVLQISGNDREIPIQLAAYNEQEKLEAKREKVPNNVVLVGLPMADIFLAYQEHDEQRLRMVVKDFTRQVLQGVKRLPKYVPVYESLLSQVGKRQAA